MKVSIFLSVAISLFAAVFPFSALADVTVPAVSGFSAIASGSSVTLSWVTPSMSGLSSFDIHASRSVLTEQNDFAAPQVSGVPQPISGQPQSVVVSGLSTGTHYFSIRAVHVTGNASPVSVVSVSVAGSGTVCFQPNAPGNPTATLGENSGTLSWLTIGGTPLSELDIRQSDRPINDFNFDAAPQVSNIPRPLANQLQSVQLSGLVSGTPYYFAFRLYNVCGVSSPLSFVQSSTASPSLPYRGGGGAQITYAPNKETSVLINGGATRTGSRLVTLSLNAEGASEMSVSNNSAFIGSPWEPFTTSTRWALEGANGMKTVYVRFRGFNRVFNDASSSIEFIESFVTPPPSVTTPAPTTVPPNESPVVRPKIRFVTSPEFLTINEGERLTVVVTAIPEEGVPTLGRMELAYPSDALVLDSVSYGSGWEPVFDLTENFDNTALGTIVKTARYPGGLREPHTFAVLTFLANKSTTGALSLSGNTHVSKVSVLGTEKKNKAYLFASLVSPANGHEENIRAFGITIGVFVMIYAASLFARLIHRRFTK